MDVGGSIEDIRKRLKSFWPGRRKGAIEHLAKTPGDEASTLLLSCTSNADAEVRRAAAIALVQRKCAPALPSLITMLRQGECNAKTVGDLVLEMGNEGSRIVFQAFMDEYNKGKASWNLSFLGNLCILVEMCGEAYKIWEFVHSVLQSTGYKGLNLSRYHMAKFLLANFPDCARDLEVVAVVIGVEEATMRCGGRVDDLRSFFHALYTVERQLKMLLPLYRRDGWDPKRIPELVQRLRGMSG